MFVTTSKMPELGSSYIIKPYLQIDQTVEWPEEQRVDMIYTDDQGTDT